MSDRITLEFPDGTKIKTTTNPQKAQWEDYYHNGEWYNISDSRLKVVDEYKEEGDKE